MASSQQIESLAAAWLARRDAGAWSSDDEAHLQAWLNESTAHRVAFLRLDAAWQCSDRLRALGAGIAPGVIPTRGSWIQAPLYDIGHAAAPLPQAPHAGSLRRPISGSTSTASLRPACAAPRQRRYLKRGFALAAALVLTLSLVFGWQRYTAVERASYSTAVGALESVTLPDGSQVTLSSDSRMEVSYSRGERRIDLQRGEAFFSVAKNPQRPFVVRTGKRRVTAVGTRFDVRRDVANLRVVVTRGVVRLESDDTPGRHNQAITLLPAGSMALTTDTGVEVHSGSLQQAEAYVSWRSGFVSFHDTPLAKAVAEFNRYNARKIVIADNAVGKLRIGGNFRWANADSFVRLLEQGFPVRAEYHGERIVLHRR